MRERTWKSMVGSLNVRMGGAAAGERRAQRGAEGPLSFMFLLVRDECGFEGVSMSLRVIESF